MEIEAAIEMFPCSAEKSFEILPTLEMETYHHIKWWLRH